MVNISTPSLQGMRKNVVIHAEIQPGKQWHEPKTAFRPRAGNSSFAKRAVERKAMLAVKAKENEMKQEKEAIRAVCTLPTTIYLSHRRIEAIKLKREAKEEKARYEKMAETMHKKRIDRLKRREKRNKMLKS
ncbi:hypothetical protein Golomagni_00369 [Golovinomyces magnicellulatus]|nr:hypothetical protein Golomagni_00369 [Golovinomyces magnicellulatus]